MTTAPSPTTILAMLSRLGNRHAMTIQQDIANLLRQIIGRQVKQSWTWRSEDIASVGAIGLNIGFSDGIPYIQVGDDDQRIELTRPVEMQFGSDPVHIDLLVVIREAWAWLRWDRLDGMHGER